MDPMMDAIFAVRRNANADFKEVAALPRLAKQQIIESFGPRPMRWPISVWGPLAGLFDAVSKHPEFHAWARLRSLWAARFFVWWAIRIVGLKKRPGYNDFLLVRWSLLGDEASALEIIERANRYDSIGCTLCWALKSLMRDYPEFAARFAGHVPGPRPEAMLQDAPAGCDRAAVLERARSIDRATEDYVQAR